jgi:hypothetical protein
MRARFHALGGTMAIAMLAGAWSCDPVHNDAVNALGPEDPSIPPGPTHRAGQDCGVCHGGSGPGKKTFVAAGTIYKAYDAPDGLQNATVILTDVNGYTTPTAVTTNEVGNFFVTTDDWAPTFPMKVAVTYNGTKSDASMKSHMGRAGSCGLCHQGDYPPTATQGPETQTTTAQVYFVNAIANFKP